MTEPRRAFLLAAGFGTRLRPLTDELPKPAWPFFDVPLAAHVLRRLSEAGVSQVIVNLHHLGDRLQEVLRPWVPGGVDVRWSPEEEILGTGGALWPWRELLAERPFFLCNADTYQELDLSDLWRFHRQKGGAATLAVRRLSAGEQAPVEIDGSGRIVRLLKARAPGSAAGWPCEFTGIHLLGPAVLEALPGGPCCINADVHARLLAGGAPLYGYDPGDGSFWSDLGTPERYLAAHRGLLRAGRLPPGSPGRLVTEQGEVEGGGRARPPSYLGPGANVEAGGTVGPLATLGGGCVVRARSRVEDSVIWGRAEVGEGPVSGVILSSTGRRIATTLPA